MDELRHVVTLSPEASEQLREHSKATDARLAALSDEEFAAREAAVRSQARARIASGELHVRPQRHPAAVA